MIKIKLLFSTLFALILLSGCQSSYDDGYSNYYYDNSQNLTTLFLVDERGLSYASIPYKCDSMRTWERTLPNGEFTFLPPDNCEFDFNGLDGLYGDQFDDIVRIVDYTNDGKGSIPYDCSSFGASSTYSDGSFEYNENDVCTFYL